MTRSSILYCLCFLSLTPYLTLALSDEQKAKIHEHFEQIGMECLKDNPITEDDIAALRSKKMPEGEDSPCFMACMLKHIGVMDDKGMLQKESALDLAKKVFDDPEELKNILEYLHSCSHVNSEKVSDGEKGCERAKLAFKCMTENASKFGFDL